MGSRGGGSLLGGGSMSGDPGHGKPMGVGLHLARRCASWFLVFSLSACMHMAFDACFTYCTYSNMCIDLHLLAVQSGCLYHVRRKILIDHTNPDFVTQPWFFWFFASCIFLPRLLARLRTHSATGDILVKDVKVGGSAAGIFFCTFIGARGGEGSPRGCVSGGGLGGLVRAGQGWLGVINGRFRVG